MIGIAGGTGSGKTTVAEGICDAVGRDNVVLLHQDSYYKDRSHLSKKDRDIINYDHPDAFDSKLLFGHLSLLKMRKTIAKPIYDYCQHVRVEKTEIIKPRDVVVLEGILVLADAKIRKMLDFMIYVDTEDDVRLTRRIKRDIAERSRTEQSVIKQYEHTVMPMHQNFVEPSKRYADIILQGNQPNNVGMLVISDFIKHQIFCN